MSAEMLTPAELIALRLMSWPVNSAPRRLLRAYDALVQQVETLKRGRTEDVGVRREQCERMLMSWPVNSAPRRLLRAYDALVQQVAELSAERDSARTGREGFARANETMNTECARLVSALATEKAAREAAERSNLEGRREHTEQFEARWAAESQRVHEKRLRLNAESEASTLRVRVAQLEEQRELARDHAGRVMAQRDALEQAIDAAVWELDAAEKGGKWQYRGDRALDALRAARSKP